MSIFVTLVHIVTCLLLIAVVLLQHGRGADVGAAFGSGASQTVFGARGAGNFLTRLTTGAAVVFMITSLALSYFTAPSVTDFLSEPETAEMVPAPETEEVPESTFPEATPIPEETAEAPAGFEAIPLPGAETPPEPGAEPAPEASPPEAPAPEPQGG